MTHIKQNLIFGLIALGMILSAGIYLSKLPTQTANASVARFAEYLATSTRAGITGTPVVSGLTIMTGPGTFGSLVLTGAATGIINLYDATSTVTNTAWATTTIATFPASMAAGTYTFDTTFQKGLLIEVIGTVPSSTITYRAN